MKRTVIWLAMLASLLMLAGCGGTLETLIKGENTEDLENWFGSLADNANVPVIGDSGDGHVVALYFADSTGKMLVKEERKIPKTLSLARETVNQWLMGPAVKDGNVQAAVSPNTVMNDINLKEGVLTIDLSESFTQAYGNVSQEVSVYGLVNTLSQFPTVKKVQIRINGKELTRLGDLDLTNLTYNESLVKGTVSQNRTDQDNSGEGAKSTDNNSQFTGSPSKINIFSDPNTV